MMCLTVCQPYASLILLPHSDPRHKRVENRTWYTSHRGPLLIHAGKSRDWLDSYPCEDLELPFGVILGRVELVACVRKDTGWAEWKYPWLRGHQHAEGPWMWVLQKPRLFDRPIPYRGAQGLFAVPGDFVAAGNLIDC